MFRAFSKKDIPFDTSKHYWEERYKSGGNSGDGSYGRLATFKAEIINNAINEYSIKSAIELGCGDGNQLKQLLYPSYIGLDISESVIARCNKIFSQDKSKRFMINSEEVVEQLIRTEQFDLALSIDVIYHLVEFEVFETYLKNLFTLSDKFVIIYSTDFDKKEAAHVIHRKFTDWVASHRLDWELISEILNPYPGVGEQESLANFYVFKKK
ncbi:hypothetical protein NIASO_01485 [Niabella soli DSM 19437]|uniref:Methyltransferase domain-containing protein n=2 Tax=Niabella TaxID=379899 RepID=W0F211_9BACT|nr:hypothetical protein NIASO_01485 [Niabella soli DSM 19437]